MFDDKEIEELCGELLSLDEKTFLESDENISNLESDLITSDVNTNFLKSFPNLKNNNFIYNTSAISLEKPGSSTQLDLLNKNFISLEISDCDNNSENIKNGSDLGAIGGNIDAAVLPLNKKENEIDNELKEIDERLVSPDISVGKDLSRQNGRSPDTLGLWHSGPSSLNLGQTCSNYAPLQDLTFSITSHSHGPQSMSSFSSSPKRTYSHQQLGAKVEMVYSLLSMLDTDNREDMSKTFLAMSSSAESCHAMRQSGCLPLLIQLIHSYELNKEVRKRAGEALHNIVHAQTDEKRHRKEVRVLKLLEQLREYCDELKNDYAQEISQLQESEKHPINAMGTLMKFSFDAEHRQAICALGGLHAVTQLLQVDHEAHGSTNDDSNCITLRRYAGMSLTNLTFGDGKNKALLCSFNKFMRALVDQLKSPSEDLRQVTASVLRNLSWRADSESKQALRNVGAVIALTISAMEGKKESTLKSILSALWNLSAHCTLNKIDICSVPGALAFLVKMLRYKSSSNTLSIVENAGGILRNISSHIAVREDYRQILRDNNCFEVLLQQLKSPSLTVVSNACGTLWNLSARCPEDQKRLWEMGATTMLRSLVQSKHKMISMGSSAALKNLLTANPDENLLPRLDSTAKSLGFQNLPTLFVRKKRALEQELNITLAETCDNLDTAGSPSHCDSSQDKVFPIRSESRDSVQSSQSDSVCERINHITLKNEDKVLENKNITLHGSLNEKSMPRKKEDQKLMRRYKTSMIPTPTFKKMNQDRINEKTREEAVVEGRANETMDEKHLKVRNSKQRNKKGIPVLNTRIKSKANQSYQISDENILLQSNDKCFEVNEDEKCCETTSSQTPKEFLESTKSHSFHIQVDEDIEGKECKNEEKNEQQCQENLVNLEEDIHYEVFPSTALSDENFPSVNTEFFERISPDCRNKITDRFHENAFFGEKEIVGQGSSEEKILSNYSLNSLNDVHQITGTVSIDFQKLPKINVKGSFKSRFEEVKKSSVEESLSDLRKETDPKEEKFKSNENFFSHMETLTPGDRSRGKMPSHVSLTRSLNFSQRCCFLGASKVHDDDHQGQDEVDTVVSSRQTDASEPESTVFSSGSANQDLDKSEILKSSFKPEQSKVMFLHESAEDLGESFLDTECELKNQSYVNADGDHLKTLSGGLFPKFKVGSPITDSSVLKMEANKICREIKKQQDFDMGCSLTSEVSLVSCSSFLDTGDYSLFDSSTDAIDFDDSENPLLGKICSKTKGYPFRKFNVSQTAESVSLPSLGSFKNDQLDISDLDNSVLSVASITSEIAETNSKDFEVFNTFTKTNKKTNAENESVEGTIADVTDVVSDGDDTLNADSLQNVEFFDEDHSLHSQENLPFDSENLQLEKTSNLVNKKLTPKEKRKTFQERYKTYTIRNFQNSDLSGKDFISDLQGLNDKMPMGCVQQNNSLDCNNGGLSRSNFDYKNEVEQVKWKNEKEKFDLPSITKNKGRKCEKYYFSKSLDKEGYMASNLVFDSRSLSDLLSIGPDERKELVDNAKLVAFSLKTAIQENEIISDSEAEDDHESVEIDTTTYSKSNRDRFFGKFSCQELQSVEQYEEYTEEGSEKKEARIIKPNDKAGEKLEHSKGIRGRKKPLYSSPQKKSPRATESSSNSPKMSKAAIVAKKPLTDACSSQVLHREGTFTKTEDISDLKKTEIKTPRIIPKLHKNVESKSLNFSRPLNKNKPVSSAVNSKRAVENQWSKIGRPLSSCASKYNERRTESDSSQRRPFSAGTGNRIGGDRAATSTKPVSSGLASPKIRNSSSNQNIKAGNSSSFVKSRNLTLQSSKSQSDASLNLVASKNKDTPGTERTPKKEVTSKIAGLWRKVEETKQRNQNLKDDRVWIIPEKNMNVPVEVLIVEKEEILDIPTRKIVHSFTCQALTDETSAHFCSQEVDLKDSREFVHVRDQEERRRKTEKRNIISAVIPPFNYNPPVSAQVLPSKIKQVDTFLNGSLKVTTV